MHSISFVKVIRYFYSLFHRLTKWNNEFWLSTTLVWSAVNASSEDGSKFLFSQKSRKKFYATNMKKRNEKMKLMGIIVLIAIMSSRMMNNVESRESRKIVENPSKFQNYSRSKERK